MDSVFKHIDNHINEPHLETETYDEHILRSDKMKFTRAIIDKDFYKYKADELDDSKTYEL